MSNDRFIGIENELMGFHEGHRVKVDEYFLRLKNRLGRYFEKEPYMIRSSFGHKLYVDRSVLEIATPPVLINRGFASRLTDLLIMGRDEVIRSSPELEHTGYSMHWNIDASTVSIDDFFEGIAVPFHLLGLTPLSVGMRIREGDMGRESGIYELLGDSIAGYDQILVTSLILGSYSCAVDSLEAKKTMPKAVNMRLIADRNPGLFLPEGRYNHVKARIGGDAAVKKIQAQQYLEIFYHWLRPFVDSLSTLDERKMVEDFIFRRKDLEFDKKKYYDCLKKNKIKEKGFYLPFRTGDPRCPGTVITVAHPPIEDRNIPLEGRLMNAIITEPRIDIDHLSWKSIRYRCSGSEEEFFVKGARNIYELGAAIDGTEIFPSSYNPGENSFYRPADIIVPERIVYDPDKDDFNYPAEQISPKKSFSESFKSFANRVIR